MIVDSETSQRPKRQLLVRYMSTERELEGLGLR